MTAPPDAPAPVRRGADARRREILEAAEHVFAHAGYRGATTEEVARRVGLTQPALYRYFKSKRELFMAALALRQQEIVARYGEALSGPGPAIDKLRALARTTVRLATEHPQMGRLRLQAMAEAAEPEVAAAVRSTLEQLLRAHEALFERAREEGSVRAEVDPAAAASGFAGMAVLLYVSIALDLPMAQQEPALDLVDRFLAGFAAQPPGRRLGQRSGQSRSDKGKSDNNPGGSSRRGP